MSSKSREQELVDIMFQVAQFSSLYWSAKDKTEYYSKQEEHMKWVAEQLKGCGFETKPMGSSWGVLVGEKV